MPEPDPNDVLALMGLGVSFPLSAGSAPLRNQLDLPEADPRFVGEMVREVRDSTRKRLGALEEVFKKLQEEAALVLGGARRDVELHGIKLYGTKLRGRCYHLYQRPDGARFFSLLEPVEYAGLNPDCRPLGSFQLNFDASWIRQDADDTVDRLKYAAPDEGQKST